VGFGFFGTSDISSFNNQVMQKADYSKYIIPAGIVVGGYLLLKKLHIFGDSATDANNSGIDSSTSAGISDAIRDAQNAGDFATISDANAAGYAATIYSAGVASPVDQYTVRNSLIQANTLTDILKIAKAFGTKQAGDSFSMCSMFGINCQAYNLQSFVRAVLSPSELAIVNNYFSNQGINYYF